MGRINFMCILWGFVSVIGAVVTFAGFCLPFWIQGELLDVRSTSFGSFVRCGYPKLTNNGVIEIVADCGRYSSFWTIPSGWWRVSTVLAGSGSTLSLLLAVTAIVSACAADLLNPTAAKIIGFLQLLSGLLVGCGVGVYPLGWGNKEVLDACSERSAPYELGTCRISWSIFLMGGGVGLLLLAFGLSFKASRIKKGSYRI